MSCVYHRSHRRARCGAIKTGLDFDVWRHGAQLKIEVYDFKDFEQDKLLCTCEVDVDDLAGAGPVGACAEINRRVSTRRQLKCTRLTG